MSRCRAAGRCPHDTMPATTQNYSRQAIAHLLNCLPTQGTASVFPVPADKSLEQLRNYQSRPLGSGHREPDAPHLEIGVDSCGRMFLSPWMPGCLPVGLHNCLRVCMSAFLRGCLPAGWLVCLRVCMSACPVCLSVCMLVCLSICLFLTLLLTPTYSTTCLPTWSHN